MAYLTDVKKGIEGRKKIYDLLKPNTFSRDSLNDDDRKIINQRHYLSDVNKILSDYYAPQRLSNSTAVLADDQLEYISYLENSHNNLSLRLAYLEAKFKAIEPYMPYMPTLAKIISDFIVVETRIEEKKKYFKEKYSVKESPKIKLWAGAEEKTDIADTTLDEILGSIEDE